MRRRRAKRDLTIEQQLARGPIDLPYLALTLLLTAIGLVMLLSSSYASAYYEHGDPYYYFTRQLGFALLGVAAMFLVPAPSGGFPSPVSASSPWRWPRCRWSCSSPPACPSATTS